MIKTLLKLELNKRLGVFLIVSAILGYASLSLAIKATYPSGAIPQLKGYCCEYCENSTECVQAAIGEELQVSKEEVCDNISSYDNAKGKAIEVPIEPFDTWTNIAYIMIALLPFIQRIRTNPTAILFTIVGLTLGFGSGLFHAAGTANGELADVFGMFIVFGFLAANSLLLYFDKKNILFLVLLTAVLTWLEFYLRSVSGDVAALGTIGVLILLPLFLSSKTSTLKHRVIISLLIFVVALIFRTLDSYFCSIFGEHSIIQGHAIWHVFSAFGIGYIFWLQQEIMEETMTLA
jgi:hypothetical protein